MTGSGVLDMTTFLPVLRLEPGRLTLFTYHREDYGAHLPPCFLSTAHCNCIHSYVFNVEGRSAEFDDLFLLKDDAFFPALAESFPMLAKCSLFCSSKGTFGNAAVPLNPELEGVNSWTSVQYSQRPHEESVGLYGIRPQKPFERKQSKIEAHKRGKAAHECFHAG